jgi:hypothetical protein
MHKTSAHWEAGAIPSKELIARVGALLGELAKAHLLLGGEGLRPSSEGVRLTFSGGTRTISVGPFKTENELPSGFSILRVPSIDKAIEWASRQAAVLGDVEIDIRPVTKPWESGPNGISRRSKRTRWRCGNWRTGEPGQAPGSRLRTPGCGQRAAGSGQRDGGSRKDPPHAAWAP